MNANGNRERPRHWFQRFCMARELLKGNSEHMCRRNFKTGEQVVLACALMAALILLPAAQRSSEERTWSGASAQMVGHQEGSDPFTSTFHQRASRILVPFLFTFIVSRITVFLIASRRIPDIYLRLGRTHVHHLNYGIFLLSGVGAYLLLGQPMTTGLRWASVLYGIGLALTFDEFGMWLHLGGSYWQRASFDAVVVVGAFFGVIVMAPHLSKFRPDDWFTAGALAIGIVIFGVMLVDSFRYAHRMLYRIQILEKQEPRNPGSRGQSP